jgi:hypothetical protein
MSALPLALDVGIEQFERLRAIFAFSSNSEVPFRRNAADALSSIFKSLHTSVAQAVEAKDAGDFQRRRGIALVTYVKLLQACSLITETEINDDDQFAVLACQSLDRLHEDLVSSGIANFGLEAADRVSFTIFTLKRIVRLVPRIATVPAPQGSRDHDRRLSAQFVQSMILSHFHLECLRAILGSRCEVIPAVAEAVLEGLDACQLAYGTLREGLQLRHENELSLSDRIEWDEEDQALLNDAERTGPPAS